MLNSNIRANAPLPLPYSLINTIGNTLLKTKLPLAELDNDALHQAAIKQFNLNDFGDNYYQAGLNHLLTSLQQDAQLNFLGKMHLKQQIIKHLSNRLRMVQLTKQAPELFKQPLMPPIIVTGMFRAGTTFLHRLLASDPMHCGVPYWSLNHPFISDEKTSDQYRKAVISERNTASKLIPDMDTKHFVQADDADECMWALGLTFTGLCFPVLAPIYGYMDWYMQQDRTQKYQDYRHLLQFYQSRDPNSRLVLKAPEHIGSLRELLLAVPNALIVNIHRDPVTCMNSYNSLLYSSMSPSVDTLDVKRMADSHLALMENEINRSLIARQTPTDNIIDVSYKQLVSNPMATIQAIYAHFDLAYSDNGKQALQHYLDQNPKGKYGKHQYSSADFGQTDNAIAQRFTDYQQQFAALL